MVFVTIAAGTVATVYFALQTPAQGTTTTNIIAPTSLPAQTTKLIALDGPSGSSERFALSWQASHPIRVSLTLSRSCPTCPDPAVLVAWPGNLSGLWTGTGHYPYPLYVNFTNPGTQSANISGRGVAWAAGPAALPLILEIAVGAGAAVLFALGGLALLLGLFLRINPYGPALPLAPRSADAVEELSSGEAHAEAGWDDKGA